MPYWGRIAHVSLRVKEGALRMDNVIVFPTKTQPAAAKRPAYEGATLFMHMRKTTLIVHLVNPRGTRTAAVGSTNKR